jgi:glycosyltransferase involved in cell wall biosynthesis
MQLSESASATRTKRPASQPARGSTMHVITGLHGGGAERLLTNLVTQQKTPNEHRCVVTLWPGGVFRPAVESVGVEVIDLGMRHRTDALRALFKLAALFRERRPAVVQGWMYHANVLASLALALAGRRHTQLIWGIFCSYVDLSEYPWTFRLVRGLGRLLSPRVDGIIYNAAEARDFHHSIGYREPRSLVIPNCLDTATFRHDPELRQLIRRELGISDDAIVVVIAARVDPMKDWASVLAAVRDIPRVVTVAIGQGTETLPPQPGFIGLGWRDDVQRVFNGADIFLLASAFGEGTSLAMVEAMSCSLPCVVTDVGGNGTFVGEAGIVVPPRQPSAIRDALLKLAADRRRREELGRAARARTVTGHSADDIAAMIRVFTRSAEETV